MEIYVDGACSNNGNDGIMGVGIVVVFSDNILMEKSIFLGKGTNNVAELLAIKEALLLAERNKFKTFTICTDSQNCIGWLSKNWKVNAPHLIPIVAEIKELMKNFVVTFKKVKGHSNDEYNSLADKLAVEAYKKEKVS